MAKAINVSWIMLLEVLGGLKTFILLAHCKSYVNALSSVNIMSRWDSRVLVLLVGGRRQADGTFLTRPFLNFFVGGAGP